jgi:hypothetical protein
MATLAELIAEAQAALGVKRARKGTAEYENYSAADLIAFAREEEARNRTRSRNPLRTHPLSPPGTQ